MFGKELLSEVTVVNFQKERLFKDYFSGWKSRDSVPNLVNDYMNKKIMLDEFISHNLPFNQVNEAFDLMHEGKR